MTRPMVLRAILIISLACNIAMVWAFASRTPQMPPRSAQEFLSRVCPHMSSEDSAILHQTFDKYQPALDEKRKAADDSMEGVRAVLAQDTVDPAALAAAMDKSRIAKAAFQQVFSVAIEDAAPRLSRPARMELMSRHDMPPHEAPNGPPPPLPAN